MFGQAPHALVAVEHELVDLDEVGLLALTHLSSRYSGGEIRDEARAYFADTEVPRDFDTVEVPLPERGPPELVRWEPRRHAPQAAAADVAG